jgi:hypothetical protein
MAKLVDRTEQGQEMGGSRKRTFSAKCSSGPFQIATDDVELLLPIGTD